MNKIKSLFLALQLKLWALLHDSKAQLADERGDTNFISIAIILIIVIAVAIVFISFRDAILGGLKKSIDELKDALGL